MKKKLFSLFLILLLLLLNSVCAFAQVDNGKSFVYDGADLLSVTEEQRLSDKLSRISGEYNAEITVITRSSTAGSIDWLVEDLYDDMGLGYGENHDGVLLLICMDVREYRILSNGFAADAISMDNIDSISDKIVSDLSDGNYYDAFDSFADECDYYLNGYLNGFPFEFLKVGLISLAVGVAVGLIVVLIMKAQLKSVKPKHNANGYVKSGSMNITHAGDYFLYSSVSKTARQTDSSHSSGGGGSRNVGGGKF